MALPESPHEHFEKPNKKFEALAIREAVDREFHNDPERALEEGAKGTLAFVDYPKTAEDRVRQIREEVPDKKMQEDSLKEQRELEELAAAVKKQSRWGKVA